MSGSDPLQAALRTRFHSLVGNVKPWGLTLGMWAYGTPKYRQTQSSCFTPSARELDVCLFR